MSQRPADQARTLLLSGKFDEAEAMLRKATDAWSLILLADLLVFRAPFEPAKIEEACGLYERASKDFPELTRSSAERARALLAAAPDPLVETLRESFGHAAFRPGQRQVIEALRKGRHALAIMTPGTGRALIPDLAARTFAKNTVVVSPRRTADGPYLQVDPAESLAERTAGRPIDLLVIDEAQCVSESSPDFRADYLRLRDSILAVRPTTVLAIAPFASTRARAEIVEKLGLQNPVIYVSSYDRPNLFFAVARAADRMGAMAAAIRDTAGPCLVYAITRADVDEAAAALRNAGIQASTSADEWTEGRTRVLVAMGDVRITRTDVRAVFHYKYPASLETYYRQVLRAGRDGQSAKCLVFFDPDDKNALRAVLDREFPSREVLSYVLGMVKEGRSQAEVLSFGGGSAAELHQSALNVLERYKIIQRTEPGRYAAVADAPSMQRLDLSEVERRRRLAEERLRDIENYLEGRACRRRAILQHFGESLPSSWNCSGCDRCRSAVTEETTRRTPEARQAILDSVRELEPRRMTLIAMARAILFLGKPIKGLTETDVKEVLHALVREGAVEVVVQGQWLKIKRK